MLKHMLRRDPKPDELVESHYLGGSDPKDLVRNISDKISESIKIKPSELNQTEADLGISHTESKETVFYSFKAAPEASKGC